MEELGRAIFDIVRSTSDGIVHGSTFIQILATVGIIIFGVAAKTLLNYFIATNNKTGKIVMGVVALIVLCVIIIAISSPSDKSSSTNQEDSHIVPDAPSSQ